MAAAKVLAPRRSTRDSTEIPPVVFLLASLLESSIQKSEEREETKLSPKNSIFHGLRAPELSIGCYLERICKYSKCSPCCFVLAEIYMDRFLRRRGAFCLTPLNVHRLLMTSVVVAAKFIDDAFFNNAYYAKIGGISTAEMNKLEMSLLFSLDFRLHVTLPVFESHCSRLQTISAAAAIEHPFRNLTTSSCASTEDSLQAQEPVRRSFSCGAT